LRLAIYRIEMQSAKKDWLKANQIEFTIDSGQMLKLFSDLRQIDLEETKRKHRAVQQGLATELKKHGERKV
jgi:hypothetical protein